jgi:16S rRNA processing protein RimM
MSADAEHILLGHIAGAHGIRGEVLITSYAEVPENIAAYGPLSDESGRRRFEVSVVRVTPKGVVARIAGIEDRTAAEQLKGTRLYLERRRLPAIGEEEFYHVDLIGLRAVAPDGAPIGEVVAVHNFGAGDILEIKLVGKGGTEMVLFSAAFVPEVDVAGGQITVSLPIASAEDSGK